jgi:hypothetical protein
MQQIYAAKKRNRFNELIFAAFFLIFATRNEAGVQLAPCRRAGAYDHSLITRSRAASNRNAAAIRRRLSFLFMVSAPALWPTPLVCDESSAVQEFSSALKDLPPRVGTHGTLPA